MKHAYLSLVLVRSTDATIEAIQDIDSRLAKLSRAHEIVLVTNGAYEVCEGAETAGPLSIVRVYPAASTEQRVMAGMSRAVGDFVLEWRGGLSGLLEHDLIEEALGRTDHSVEIAHLVSTGSRGVSRMMLAATNAARRGRPEITMSVGTMFSRRALGALLMHEPYESSLRVLVAELPYRSAVIRYPQLRGARSQGCVGNLGLMEWLSILARGTNLGKTVPLVVAGLFALIAALATVWAVIVYVVSARTPEGWTTIMAFLGIGQASTLVMLGLVWSQLNSLRRAVAGRLDVVASVEVIPTKYERYPPSPAS
jgi:hypothetical protein